MAEPGGGGEKKVVLRTPGKPNIGSSEKTRMHPAGASSLLKMLEEPELERRFGTTYREYKRRVPMFVPTLRGAIKGKRRVV